jgi:transaldolase
MVNKKRHDRTVDIYADCANLAQIEQYADHPRVRGFTTNPTLMKRAGITDYRAFAASVLRLVRGKPVSFEVLADDWPTMERQANEIQSWGDNVYVKIPVTNTRGESSRDLIHKLGDLNLNVTAVMTRLQLYDVLPHMRAHHILSVFAGRITDTHARVLNRGAEWAKHPARWLWASTREVYSYRRAQTLYYQIITMTPDLIDKMGLARKDLTEYSLETVRQFHKDGEGLTL